MQYFQGPMQHQVEIALSPVFERNLRRMTEPIDKQSHYGGIIAAMQENVNDDGERRCRSKSMQMLSPEGQVASCFAQLMPVCQGLRYFQRSLKRLLAGNSRKIRDLEGGEM